MSYKVTRRQEEDSANESYVLYLESQLEQCNLNTKNILKMSKQIDDLQSIIQKINDPAHTIQQQNEQLIQRIARLEQITAPIQQYLNYQQTLQSKICEIELKQKQYYQSIQDLIQQNQQINDKAQRNEIKIIEVDKQLNGINQSITQQQQKMKDCINQNQKLEEKYQKYQQTADQNNQQFQKLMANARASPSKSPIKQQNPLQLIEELQDNYEQRTSDLELQLSKMQEMLSKIQSQQYNFTSQIQQLSDLESINQNLNNNLIDITNLVQSTIKQQEVLDQKIHMMEQHIQEKNETKSEQEKQEDQNDSKTVESLYKMINTQNTKRQKVMLKHDNQRQHSQRNNSVE